MNSLIPFVFVSLIASAGFAQSAAETTSEDDAAMAPKEVIEINLNDFLWQKRPIVVFADTDADPAFREQIELLTARANALEARDVVILTDTDPASGSELRTKLRPRGFMLVLIGKDGGVKLRKPFPWDVRELTRVIDKMPLRKQEIRDRLRNGE